MEPEVTSALTVLDLIKIALTSGVVAAVVSGIAQWLREAGHRTWVRSRAAESEAIFIAAKLDAIALDCARNIFDFDEQLHDYIDTHGAAPSPSCTMPSHSFSGIPIANIDRGLAAKIAWLENEVRSGQQIISIRYALYLDPPEAFEQHRNLVGYLGYEAMVIARQLREKYKLRPSVAKWGVSASEETFNKCKQEAEKFLATDG